MLFLLASCGHAPGCVLGRTQTIEDMCLMVMGRPDELRHPLLKKLKTAKKLIRFIQESGDRQWASRVRFGRLAAFYMKYTHDTPR